LAGYSLLRILQPSAILGPTKSGYTPGSAAVSSGFPQRLLLSRDFRQRAPQDTPSTFGQKIPSPDHRFGSSSFLQVPTDKHSLLPGIIHPLTTLPAFPTYTSRLAAASPGHPTRYISLSQATLRQRKLKHCFRTLGKTTASLNYPVRFIGCIPVSTPPIIHLVSNVYIPPTTRTSRHTIIDVGSSQVSSVSPIHGKLAPSTSIPRFNYSAP
jgi:hypothetical protein